MAITSEDTPAKALQPVAQALGRARPLVQERMTDGLAQLAPRGPRTRNRTRSSDGRSDRVLRGLQQRQW